MSSSPGHGLLLVHGRVNSEPEVATRLGLRLGNTALWTDKNILGDDMNGWNNR